MNRRIVGGVELRQDNNGRWLDEFGVEYGLPDEAMSADREVRAGVGKLSLPADHWTAHGVRYHDAAYSTPAYMRSRPRSEADRMLRDHLLIVAGRNPLKRATAHLFYGLSRLCGWAWWEDDKTRWK